MGGKWIILTMGVVMYFQNVAKSYCYPECTIISCIILSNKNGYVINSSDCIPNGISPSKLFIFGQNLLVLFSSWLGVVDVFLNWSKILICIQWMFYEYK